MEYGLQMYSVRDITEQDLEGALKKVSEVGYKFVEFAGFFGHSAETVKGWLDKYGLVASGTHTGWEQLRDNYEATVQYHKTIGCSNIIIPAANLGSRELLDGFINFVNEVTPKLEADGMTLGYHNHHFEFVPNFYNQPDMEGVILHEELQNRTKLNFEIDTYWAFVGKQNPVEVLEKLKDRIQVIHLKDGEPDGSKGYSLGLGYAPVSAVRKKAIELGIKMVVESEGLNPTGIEEAARSFKHLKDLDNFGWNA